jgi:hypothetical protein
MRRPRKVRASPPAICAKSLPFIPGQPRESLVTASAHQRVASSQASSHGVSPSPRGAGDVHSSSGSMARCQVPSEMSLCHQSLTNRTSRVVGPDSSSAGRGGRRLDVLDDPVQARSDQLPVVFGQVFRALSRCGGRHYVGSTSGGPTTPVAAQAISSPAATNGGNRRRRRLSRRTTSAHITSGATSRVGVPTHATPGRPQRPNRPAPDANESAGLFGGDTRTACYRRTPRSG